MKRAYRALWFVASVALTAATVLAIVRGASLQSAAEFVAMITAWARVMKP